MANSKSRSLALTKLQSLTARVEVEPVKEVTVNRLADVLPDAGIGLVVRPLVLLGLA